LFEKTVSALVADAFDSSLKQILESILPGGFIAMQVDNREDHDVALLDSVEDAVWKPARWSPTSIAVDRLVLKRILGNPVEDSVNFCDKLAPQAWELSFVPSSCATQVSLGLTSG
jgi:hypothetical protein